MKYIRFSVVMLALVANMCVSSCKGKSKPASTIDTTTNNLPTDTTMAAQPAPVQVSPDDSLTTMARDAVQDYPDVKATVNNGEVTLTGNITRIKLPKLMMAISAMHPKKINNNLTIK